MNHKVKSRELPTRFLAVSALAAVTATLTAVMGPSLLRSAAGLAAAAWWLAFGCAVLLLMHRRRSSQTTVGRWNRQQRKSDGMATGWDLWRTASAWAMHRRATVLRPSLAGVSWWQRWRTPTTELATRVATVGWLGIWSPVEDVTLRLGGPRTGKTGELACRIIDAPGPVVATSTRTDLVSVTGALRAEKGPVHIFNPSALGGLATTVKFSPLLGCERLRTAQDRAADLVGASSTGTGADSGDRAFWAGQAREVLSVMMHAAALLKEDMHTVAHWLATPEEAEREVLAALDRSPAADDVRQVAEAFFSTNDRTQTSITTSIRPALTWLTDEHAASVAEGAEGDMLDIPEFLQQSGTIFLLGAEDAVTAPLVACLTAEIARTARRIASESPAGRIDPPLTLALDEAALICPIPLDKWTADMGGRNVTIHIGAQSRAQLRQRWGADGAAAILNNAGTILVFGGMRDPDDLAAFSSLSGEREEVVYNRDANGVVTGSSTRTVPVLSGATLAALPAGQVMVVRRGVPVSVGRVQLAWQRRQVQRVLRQRGGKRMSAMIRRAGRLIRKERV